MFGTEEYNDKIDAYLKGNLSAGESAAFESAVSSDPALKAEVLFQTSLISSLQENRKAELKSRLNNIKIPAVKPVYWRYGALAGAITAIVVGLYYLPENLFKSTKSEIRIANSDKLENLGDINVTPEEPEKAVTKENTLSPTNELRTEKGKQTNPVSKADTKYPAQKESSKEILPSLPEIHSPEISGHDHISKEVETPDHSLTKSKHVVSSVAGVEVVKSKKHKFHYRYFDTQLFLYGDFETKTYDILELNNSKGQKLYLKFESNYYELKPDKTEISKLDQVKSKDVLKELEDIQKK